MAKWDLQKIGEFKERHLNTNKLFDDQIKLTTKHNALIELAVIVSQWIERTKTANNSEYRGFKNHFIGNISAQWTNVIQLGKDLQEIEKLDVLSEVQSKFEIGLNLLDLIKRSLEEIGSLCTFFCNEKKVRKKIQRAYKGQRIIKLVLQKAIEKLPRSDEGGLEFFHQTEVLIGSMDWNYVKAITEQGEHNLRKVMDAFF